MRPSRGAAHFWIVPTTEVKTHLGASSPANPALMAPEPMSTTMVGMSVGRGEVVAMRTWGRLTSNRLNQ
jgi:hypothetical protein